MSARCLSKVVTVSRIFDVAASTFLKLPFFLLSCAPHIMRYAMGFVGLENNPRPEERESPGPSIDSSKVYI